MNVADADYILNNWEQYELDHHFHSIGR